jgi:hypothetical protein
MGLRRIMLGAAAGALSAAAVLPIGLAFADDGFDGSVFDPLLAGFYGFRPDASQPATVYSISGEPPIFQSVHDTEVFDTGATGMLPAGSFQVDNEVITSAFGPASDELLVTGSVAGTSAPPVGSVYDVIAFGGGFENVYSDIAPATPGGPDTLSDTLVTPFGNVPIATHLHAFLNPADAYFRYNPVDPLTPPTDASAVATVDDTTAAATFFDHYFGQLFGFTHDASQPTTVTDIAAIPPIYQSVHQTESFETAANGTLPAGSFQADDNILTTTMGPNFSELLVTGSQAGTSAPPVGSVYEINNLGNGVENVYSDIAPSTPGGADTLSDTLVTPFGDLPLMTNLHAFFDSTYSYFRFPPTDPSAVAFAGGSGFDPTQPFAFFGFTHDASEPTTVTGVSGLTGVAGFLPSFDSVHLNEFFDAATAGTLPAGSFQADSNVITTPTGLANVELLVTGASSGTSAPPVGSVYDVIAIGNGVENFYSDIPTAGGPDTLSDVLVTPFGDLPLMVDFHSFVDPADVFFAFAG